MMNTYPMKPGNIVIGMAFVLLAGALQGQDEYGKGPLIASIPDPNGGLVQANATVTVSWTLTDRQGMPLTGQSAVFVPPATGPGGTVPTGNTFVRTPPPANGTPPTGV